MIKPFFILLVFFACLSCEQNTPPQTQEYVGEMTVNFKGASYTERGYYPIPRVATTVPSFRCDFTAPHEYKFNFAGQNAAAPLAIFGFNGVPVAGKTYLAKTVGLVAGNPLLTFITTTGTNTVTLTDISGDKLTGLFVLNLKESQNREPNITVTGSFKDVIPQH
jgi:hypothetical protein